MKPVIRPAARDDILRQYQYYISEGAYDAADRFIDAVGMSIKHLSRMPETGAPRNSKNPVLSGLRSWPVKGFEDIRIYYLTQNKKMRVIRVLHGRRDIQKILENDIDNRYGELNWFDRNGEYTERLSPPHLRPCGDFPHLTE